MPTVVDENDQAATLDTEHTLTTQTTDGVYTLAVDLNNLAAGDIVILRIYGKVRTGGTERLLFSGNYGPIPPTEKFAMSPPVLSPHHFKATLEQTDGTGRTFPWAVYST